MPGSPTLEIVVGLSFVYLVHAILCTTANELFAGVSPLRVSWHARARRVAAQCREAPARLLPERGHPRWPHFRQDARVDTGAPEAGPLRRGDRGHRERAAGPGGPNSPRPRHAATDHGPAHPGCIPRHLALGWPSKPNPIPRGPPRQPSSRGGRVSAPVAICPATCAPDSTPRPRQVGVLP